MEITMEKNKINIIDLPKYKDDRGFLSSYWKSNSDYPEFVEDRYSYSHKHVLRGLHGDSKIGKLIVPIYGVVQFFAKCYNKDSKYFGEEVLLELDYQDPQAIYLPPHYINGHLCLSKECIFLYKWTDYYNGPDEQVTVRYDDPSLAVEWDSPFFVLSERDKKGILYEDLIA